MRPGFSVPPEFAALWHAVNKLDEMAGCLDRDSPYSVQVALVYREMLRLIRRRKPCPKG